MAVAAHGYCGHPAVVVVVVAAVAARRRLAAGVAVGCWAGVASGLGFRV